MSEEEIVKVMEDRISLNDIIFSKSTALSKIEDFINDKVHTYADTLVNYGYIECLFMLNLIDEKLFIEKTNELSNLLKESNTDEA